MESYLYTYAKCLPQISSHNPCWFWQVSGFILILQMTKLRQKRLTNLPNLPQFAGSYVWHSLWPSRTIGSFLNHSSYHVRYISKTRIFIFHLKIKVLILEPTGKHSFSPLEFWEFICSLFPTRLGTGHWALRWAGHDFLPQESTE